MEPIQIPRTIDDLPHLFVWTADEFAPFAIGLGVGFFTGYVMTCGALGLLGTKLYIRFRDGRPDGIFPHTLYWFGWSHFGKQVRTIPNPFIRQFLP